MSIVVKCPACGVQNKVNENSKKSPVCGKCKSPLIIRRNTDPTHLTDADFDNFIRNSHKPILVDFWAQWCAPCRLLGPVLDSFSRSQNAITVAKIDTDRNPLTASRFQVFSIPTLILFDEGKEAKRMTGALGLQQLEMLLKPWLTTN